MLSARNASTTTSLSTRKPPNKAQISPNPKIDIRVSQIRNNVEETDKEELVPMSADKPYGLDVENFLPVSLFLKKKYMDPSINMSNINST